MRLSKLLFGKNNLHPHKYHINSSQMFPPICRLGNYLPKRISLSRFRKFSSNTNSSSPSNQNMNPENQSPQFPVWKALGFSAICGSGILIYYFYERSRLESSRIKNDRYMVYFTQGCLGKLEASGVMGAARIGGPLKLIDQNGQLFDSSTLNDTFMLVYFGFTHCPDVCPEELDKMSQILELLKDKDSDVKILPVFVTVDPERDGPTQIKEYLKDFHPSFVGLTGSKEEVKAAAKQYRVYFRPAKTSGIESNKSRDYLVDHSIFFFLIDPKGQYVTHFGRESSPERCAKIISDALFAWEVNN